MKVVSPVLALLALVACSAPGGPLEPDGSFEPIPFSYDPPRDCLALGIGAERNEESDAITLTLGLKNVCAEPLWLHGDGEPSHDFFLLNEAGETVWRWRTFPVLDIFETFTLEPGEERLFRGELDSSEVEGRGETLRLVGYYDGGTEWGDEGKTQPRLFKPN